MASLRAIVSDKRKLLGAMLLIFILAAALRFCNIQWSISDNGVDEGIMLMRARMLDQGFGLYSEIPCDQAPLAFLMAAPFGGEVLASRALSAILSVAAIAACVEAAKRVRGDIAMLATGMILAVDFAFLRESRLFSLDGMAAYFLAFSLVPLLSYVKSGSRVMLALAGLLLGLSAASKLYGAVAVLAVLVFICAEALADRRKGIRATSKVADAAIVLCASAIPLGALLALLGPSDMLQGMLFDQGHREFDLVMKLSIPLYFAFNVAFVLPFVYARALWTLSREARLLLCLSVVPMLNFVLQPLVFLHNLIMMSPPLAVLVGVLAADRLEPQRVHSEPEKKVIGAKTVTGFPGVVVSLIVVGIVVSAGVASYGLAVQGKSSQEVYGERIASWTDADDWILSGDPLIAAYAERSVPLSMINMGTRIYPEIALQDVEDAIVAHGVAVVVVCYRLLENDMTGLADFLEGRGYRLISKEALGEWHTPAIDTGSNEQVPLVYVTQDIADRFHLPTVG